MFLSPEKGILVPFLTARRKEVIDIMEMLFSQEEVWEMTKKEIARDSERRGEQRGEQKGIEAGICAMITTLQELSFSQEDTTQKLVSKFALPFQVAAEKVRQYWVQ